ncbi:tRNA:m(4)X modification enzyme TRM13-like protein [Leptotrombidium deliense]|uniref:tRNA:m(4)X modification enzyme TRM13-like protein n=1 Tax=Leptotrombidium deliense TaxID=299467 RepID=A0A443S9V1_9ACAR|nr:tRNA:m(4)X modification enzyme TRM13-like protein [Leptotrombidium deliense]
MATFDDFQDDLVTCPYNPAHKIARRRLQAHLIKCEKNSNVHLMECPFNSSHRMEMHEYQKHIDNCPDSRQIMREMHQHAEMASMKKEKKEEFVPRKDVDDGDDEWNSPGEKDNNFLIAALKDNVDVDKHKNKVGFVDPLLLQRMTKSERAQFYDERLQNAKQRTEEEEKRKKNPTEFTLKVKEEGKVKEEVEAEFKPPKNIQTFGGVGRGMRIPRT